MRHARVVGQVLEGAEAARLFVLGLTGDSDPNHHLMDHVLVGVKAKIAIVRVGQIPLPASAI